MAVFFHLTFPLRAYNTAIIDMCTKINWKMCLKTCEHPFHIYSCSIGRVIIIITLKYIKKRITSVAVQMLGNAGTNAGCAIWTVKSIHLCNILCLYLILQGRLQHKSILVSFQKWNISLAGQLISNEPTIQTTSKLMCSF